jgi:flagellar hook-associated protein 2
MTSLTAPSYDPVSTATGLAQQYTAISQKQLATDTALAAATMKALSSLGSAISAFQGSLGSLTGLGKSMLAQSATLSDTTVGTASAKPSAAAGTYSLFVQQLATASQVSYNNLADGAAVGGTLKVKLSNESTVPATATASFDVDLSAATADTDKDGKLSIREVAAAINSSTGNTGLVSAGVVTIGTETRLVLTSKNTGVANTVSLDPSAVSDATLKSGLGTRSVVTNAQDAIVLLGGKAGTPIQQSSNTFTNIDGVSLTITRAQAASENAISLAVKSDSDGTVKNVQAFVDAYNKLVAAIKPLVALGSAAGADDGSVTKGGGAFAHDSGIKALQSHLVDLMRPTGSVSLASYGITGNRDGTLSLDTTRLNKQLAVNPSGLDQLIGSSSLSAPSGVAGALSTYLDKWSNSTTGQINQRTAAATKQQSDLAKRQSTLDAQYDSAYKRYLKQFTQLQTLQASMTSNLNMFQAMFSNDKS